MLCLQQYCFKVVYQPGKDNLADFMPRHPTSVSVKENMADEYVRNITTNAIPKAMTTPSSHKSNYYRGLEQSVLTTL